MAHCASHTVGTPSPPPPLQAPGSSQQASLALSAVRHSNVELLDRLFALGVPVHELEQYGNTAMGEACRNGDMAVAEWLLQHGANASETKADGTSALGAAAYAGHFELMWRLHEAGASLHGTNEQGGTTLMSAVHHKNEKEAGRLADALVLAASGGPELWTATRDKYLQTAQTPFMRMLGAVVHEDFAGYVGASSLATWRETLALLNTYACLLYTSPSPRDRG